MINELWVPLPEMIPALGNLGRSGTSEGETWVDQSSVGQRRAPRKRRAHPPSSVHHRSTEEKTLQ